MATSTGKKILVVFGATGKQGGSIINNILADPTVSKQYALRGITRDPSKPAAQTLTKRGVECVTGDANDLHSIEAAFKGAYAAFAVTDYWSKMDSKLEYQQGKNIADAAKSTGISHLIWSSLLNIKDLTHGKWPNVYHFDSKADVEVYIRKLGIPATFFMPGFYITNLPGGSIMPSFDGSGKYMFAFAGARSTILPLFSADDDTGKFVKAILTHREKLLGERVYAASGYYSLDDIMAEFQKAFPVAGKDMQFMQLPEDKFKGFLSKMPPHAQQEMWENMMFMDEFGYFGKASLDSSIALLDEKPVTPAEFFKKAEAFKDLK